MPKLSQKTELTEAATDDVIYITDTSDTTAGPSGTSKRITLSNALLAPMDATSYNLDEGETLSINTDDLRSAIYAKGNDGDYYVNFSEPTLGANKFRIITFHGQNYTAFLQRDGNHIASIAPFTSCYIIFQDSGEPAGVATRIIYFQDANFFGAKASHSEIGNSATTTGAGTGTLILQQMMNDGVGYVSGVITARTTNLDPIKVRVTKFDAAISATNGVITVENIVYNTIHDGNALWTMTELSGLNLFRIDVGGAAGENIKWETRYNLVMSAPDPTI